MFQKITLIALIIMGALLVLGLIIIRADLQKTSGQSNRKKRLIELGLSLLVFIGLGSLVPGCEADREARWAEITMGADKIIVITSGAPQSVANTGEWKRLADVWVEALPIARGDKGPYPFTEDEQKDLLNRLDRADREMNNFFESGMLRQAEWEILNTSILSLKDDIARFRSVELKDATCYITINLPGSVPMKRVKSRLPIILKMVESDTLQAPIVEQIVTSLELEVEKLETEARKAQEHDPDFFTEANSVVAEARDTIEKLKTILQKAEPSTQGE